MNNKVDRHDLYQKSVQDPETEINLMVEKYQKIRGRAPVSFREDFCGTAFLSVEWCKSNPENTAIGVDLCTETLEWGRQHNLEPAGKDISDRVTLVNANVLDVKEPQVDISCAFNFSYCIFKDRDTLRGYFEAAHKSLNQDGVFVMDIFGGSDAMDAMEEDREVDEEDFVYIWDQEKFNPVTNEIICNIHFQLADGTRLDQAFRYDWRLWSIPEVTELLKEAGFSAVHVYWEKFEDTDDDDEYLEGTGEYIEVTDVENQESWVSYIFAEV